MIIDALENLTAYRGRSAALDRAIDFLQDADPSTLEEGRIDISGKEVYALVQSYDTRRADETPFESHRDYVDVQVVVAGNETMYWAPTDSLPVTDAYDPAKDAALYGDARSVSLDMQPGWFCIFFPWDGHKPGCRAGEQATKVRKIVVKCRHQT